MNKYIKNVSQLAAVALIAISSAASAKEMTLQDTKSFELDQAGLSQFSISAGSGFLKVVGDNTNQIRVTAEIYQYEAHDKYCLDLNKSGDMAYLKAGNRCDEEKGWEDEHRTRIDLTVYMPSALALSISDGSGSLSVRNVSDLGVKDGSGKITIEDVNGSLKISDGSGSLSVRNVQGSAIINDGSGDIYVEDVTGDVEIHDGSSSIEVVNAGGTVTVSDGSGSINVNGAGNFVLVSDGSGKVNLNNIAGEIKSLK